MHPNWFQYVNLKKKYLLENDLHVKLENKVSFFAFFFEQIQARPDHLHIKWKIEWFFPQDSVSKKFDRNTYCRNF